MPPVKPRDAASLAIHRRRRTHHELPMGRRGSRARFKPGVYVYPGGVLERSDYAARPAAHLHGEVLPKLAVARSHNKADTLAMAAVREAFEEAGLICGVPGDVGGVAHTTWNHLRERELSPNLSLLQFIGRAITPSYQPLRFHARFFSIESEHLSGNIKGDGELEDLQWIRIDRTEGLELMIVQEMVLHTLARLVAGDNAPAQRLVVRHGKGIITDA